MFTVHCGIDWAQDRHDVALVDQAGKVLARLRINDDADGYRRLVELMAEHEDSPVNPIPVAIETPAGCWSPPCARPAAGVRDQPVGSIALPRPARGQPEQVRHRRRCCARQHCAHRRLRAPAAASRYRTGPSHRGACPRPAGRGLEPPAAGQSAPLVAVRVLPGRADRVFNAKPTADSRALMPARSSPWRRHRAKQPS